MIRLRALHLVHCRRTTVLARSYHGNVDQHVNKYCIVDCVFESKLNSFSNTCVLDHLLAIKSIQIQLRIDIRDLFLSLFFQ